MNKRVMFAVILSLSLSAHSMDKDFLSCRRYGGRISGSVVIGTSLIGMGLWTGVEAYCDLGAYSNILDQTIKQVEKQETFNQSIATMSLGVSLLSWLSSGRPYSYLNSIMR